MGVKQWQFTVYKKTQIPAQVVQWPCTRSVGRFLGET